MEIAYQPASLDIWDAKYRLRDLRGVPVDSSVEDTFRRVAKALAAAEPKDRDAWEERFFQAMAAGAVPAGRILANAGAGAHKPNVSLINCTVSMTVQDSMDGILKAVHEAGLTLKAGCGIGYDFSTLRPKGAMVRGAGASTSGPLSFMDVFDAVCRTISSAGGRRGAQMGVMDIGHPDIEDFIRAKREAGRLRQFNLSCLVTREFLEAVKEDRPWSLAFPALPEEIASGAPLVYRPWPVTEGYATDEAGRVAMRVYKTVPARRLWHLIMASTYDYAEPGFILIDEVNRMNNNWFCEQIRASNPCVTADAWVHTAEGPRQVRELIGVPFLARVDGAHHASGPEGFFRTATKPVVRLETAEGYSLRLTADHRVRRVVRFTRYATETEWCAAGKLKAGDRVLLNDHRANIDWDGTYGREEGYLLGLLVGDGVLKADKAVLSVWAPAAVANGAPAELPAGVQAVMAEALAAARALPHRSDFAGWRPVAGRGEYRLSLAAIKNVAEALGLEPGNKTVTPAMERTSSAFYRGFLRGLFDADGSVQGSQEKGVSVRLAQSDLACLEAVQRMLLRLGIAAKIYRNRRVATESTLPDGKGGSRAYPVKPQHELVVSGENLRQFAEVVGFGDTDKAARLQQALAGYRRELNRERFVARVESVVEDGVEDVYDVQIPGINTFDANGLHAHNCGEQMLPPHGACLLGSVNLVRFVREPFTGRSRFDWTAYRETVAVFTRMLDNVVEIAGLPLPEQRREIEEKRRHGMGIMGLGSALALLGIPYGSEEAVRFTEDVMREMAITGWRMGLALAREKGPAPILERELEVTPAMLTRMPELARDGVKAGDKLPGRVLHARYSRYMGRIAEIDPALVEQLARVGARFTHHSSIAPTGTISLSVGNNVSNGIEPSFAHQYFRNVIREGRKTKERVEVLSYEYLAWRELVDASALPEDLPPCFSTAEVDPMAHLAVQAAAQKWVDSSISKTINVPTDYPFEAFKDLYMRAAELGLKGCTTFRFNPEAFQGVLVKEEDLKSTTYRFTLEDGSVVEARGDEEVWYEGETHTAANLFDALKEGYYGRY